MFDPNSIFDGSPAFPFVEVAKSATPSGDELMNRTGLRSTSKRSKPMGRPRKPKPKLLTHPKDPALTAVVFSDDDEQTIRQGAVLQVRMADGELRSIVLLHDTKIAPLN